MSLAGQRPPSPALAGVIVDELVRGGVTEAVLSPGSRSGPLALALHAAARDGRLRLHVRVDERTAGFLALGLAKASGRPVPVTCTSGTAVANLHPAVLEAHHAGVPLVVVSADRPAELRGVGANQASELQPQLFGAAPRLTLHLATPTPGAPPDAWPVPAWRGTVARALAAARGALSADPGPVHLDVAFAEPLLGDVTPVPGGRPGPAPWTDVRAGGDPSPAPAVTLPTGPATLVVAGDGAGPGAGALARQGGWPLLAEPSSGAWLDEAALPAAPVVLGELAGQVERVVVYGHPTLSREVTALLGRADVELVVIAGPRWPDAGHRAALVVPATAGVAPAPGSASDPATVRWRRRWGVAAAAASSAVGRLVDRTAPTGPGVARAVAAALPAGSLLTVGASALIRDLDWAEPRRGVGGSPGGSPGGDVRPPVVLANRGLAGIDGTVSTAVGAALAHQAAHPGRPAYALLGDLAFLHDANGLLLGPDEPRPDLTLVVVNDDGGGIFHTLEQGAPPYAAAFERVFGTPHGVDLGALCAATRTPHVVVGSLGALRAELASAGRGLRVVEVRIGRAGRRELSGQLTATARAAIRGVLTGQG